MSIKKEVHKDASQVGILHAGCSQRYVWVATLVMMMMNEF